MQATKKKGGKPKLRERVDVTDLVEQVDNLVVPEEVADESESSIVDTQEDEFHSIEESNATSVPQLSDLVVDATQVEHNLHPGDIGEEANPETLQIPPPQLSEIGTEASIFPSREQSKSPDVQNEPDFDLKAEEVVADIAKVDVAVNERVTKMTRGVSVLYPSLPHEPIEHPKINYEPEIPESMIESQPANVPLNEEQLRTFYMNPLLDHLDENVDTFIQKNVHMESGYVDEFYSLVLEYLEAVRAVEIDDKAYLDSQSQYAALFNSVWKISHETITKQGKCGDKKSAVGEIQVQVASMNSKNLKAVSENVVRSREVAVEKRAVSRHQCASLRLQCQWNVSSAVQNYIDENRVTSASPVSMIQMVDETDCHRESMHCIDVLFHFLRQPSLPTAFESSLKQWLSCLVSGVQRALHSGDQLYLLNHLLRCPVELGEWASGFLQPVCEGMQPQQSVDHFVSLLACLVSPVRRREDFLQSLISHHNTSDELWTVVDDSGVEEDSRLFAVPEIDLLSLLHQFEFDHLFSRFLNSFIGSEITNAMCLRVFSFELTFIKVVADGMHTYDREAYKQFCRRLAYVMRQSVQYVSEFWDICKENVSLNRELLQREMDRLLLFVIHCLVASRKLGVWQFLVDLPYSSVREDCLARALHLLCLSQIPSLTYICTSNSLQSDECLVTRVGSVDDSDCTYLLIAASRIACKSNDPAFIQHILRQILQVCFVEESLREKTYKVGEECVGSILSTHPTLFPALITFIDRNLSLLDQYCERVFMGISLERMPAGVEQVIIVGKWLVTQLPHSTGSRVAQSILGGLDWSRAVLPPLVHQSTAESLISAHHTHCSMSNSMLSLSWKKASKMISRIPDVESKFDSFCWSVLLKLKIDVEFPLMSQSSNLLAVYLKACRCVSIDEVVPALESLGNAQCNMACICLLNSVVCRAIIRGCNPEDVQSLLPCVLRVVSADASVSYLSYFLSSSSPSSICQFLASAIVNGMISYVDHWESLASCWIYLLTQTKPTWNSESNVLYVVDRIVQCAFTLDESMTAIKAQLLSALKTLATNTTNVGLMGWFTSYAGLVPLVSESLYSQYEYLSMVGILVEEQQYESVYSLVDQTLLANPSATIESSVKQCGSKVHLSLTHNDLSISRWVSLILSIPAESGVLPVAIQQVMLKLLRRYTATHGSKCVGLAYLRAVCYKEMWGKLKEDLNTKYEQCAVSSQQIVRDATCELVSAVRIWLGDARLFTPNAHQIQSAPLDFLVHLLMSGDKALWWHYIDLQCCRQRCSQFSDVFAGVLALNPVQTHEIVRSGEMSGFGGGNAMQRLCNRLNDSAFSNTIYCPPKLNIPCHPPQVPLSVLKTARKVLGLLNPPLKQLSICASQFHDLCASLETCDVTIISTIPKLYSRIPTQASVVLRCGSSFERCTNPNTVRVQTYEWMLSQQVYAQLEQMQSARNCHLAKLNSSPWVDVLPQHTAVISHIINILLSRFRTSVQGSDDFVSLHHTGMCVLSGVVSSFDGSLLSCAVTRLTYLWCLETLSGVLVRDQATQQLTLLSWLIDRGDLVPHLVPHFSPSILDGLQFVEVYQTLHNFFLNSSFESPALMALFSKLDMNISLSKCSPDQILSLMYFINACLTRKSRRDSQLHAVVSKHWCSCSTHNYPRNLLNSVKIMMQGCVTGLFPGNVMDEVVDNIVANPPMDPATAEDVASCVYENVSLARHKHGVGLFNVWTEYISPVAALGGLCLQQTTLYLNDSSQLSVVEDGVQRWFDRVVQVFSPILSPLAQVVAPWTPDDNTVGQTVITSFIDVLCAIHSRTERLIPRGSGNVVSLFWNHYVTTLAPMTRGGGHVIKAWQIPTLKLAWKSFFPSLMAMDGLRKVLDEGADECIPLVTSILVRVDWNSVVQQSYCHQPSDAQTLFMHLLLYVSLHCAKDPHNYQDCQASFPRLLQSVAALPWNWLDSGHAQSTLQAYAQSVTPEMLLYPEKNVHSLVLDLVQAATGFQSVHVEGAVAKEHGRDTVLKQTAFTGMYCTLLYRAITSDICSVERANQLLTHILDINESVIHNHNLYAEETCEFAVRILNMLGTIPRQCVESMIECVVGWILNHPDSVMLYLFVSTAPSSPLSFAECCKLVESCLQAHFLKSNSDEAPVWDPLLRWVNMPPQWHTSLRKEHTAGPWLFTLHASLTLQFSVPHEDQLEMETAILTELLALLNCIKLKPVNDEAGVVLIVARVVSLVVRQVTYGVSNGQQSLTQLTTWCFGVAEDKQGFLGSIGIAKKKLFSNKFKLLCVVLGAYLTQQTLPDDSVRLSNQQPVLQSRVQMVRDLLNHKYYGVYGVVVESALVYFVDPGSYNLCHTPQLICDISRQLYIDKCLTALPL